MRTILIPIDEIYPSPENATLYRPVDENDPTIEALATSIAERGLLEPLVVTSDHYIISGHRRHTAAKLASLEKLHCRISLLSRLKDIDGFVVALREHNRQRVKSLDETIREAAVSADPQIAYEALIQERWDRSRINVPTLHLREEKARKEITDAKFPFLVAIRRVLQALEDFLPVSQRQIHYNLLNNPPLRNAGNPNSTYRNDKTVSYTHLTLPTICSV